MIGSAAWARPGLTGLAGVQHQLLDRVLADSECTHQPLHIDATLIVAEKATAHWTYMDELGYVIIEGHLVETGLVVGDVFRDGNDAPSGAPLGIHPALRSATATNASYCSDLRG